MINLSIEDALKLLEHNKHKYLSEWVAIKDNIPPVPRSIFTDDMKNNIMMIDEFNYGSYVWIKDSQYPFLEECFDWLKSKFKQFRLASLDAKVFDDYEFRKDLQLNGVKSYRSFVCTSIDNITEQSDIVKKLSTNDVGLVSQFDLNDKTNRRSLEQLFDEYVVSGEGEIYTILQNGEISSFLACYPFFQTIWDVDFIYVRPQDRGKGLGSQIAAAYAKDILSRGHGHIPYYSGVTNPASERAALKAGFVCCRELFCSDITVQ